MNAEVEIPDDVDVVWSPLAGSQTLAISCPANHILYEGTRGPGKTDSQLLYFRRFVGIGFNQFWRGVIFDKEYKNLDDLISKSKRWFPQFNDGAKFVGGGQALKWVWPTGEELWFRTMATDADYWKYHGQEFPFIGWNELTKQPNGDLYEAAMSLNRTSYIPELHASYGSDGERIKTGEIPLVVFSTTNPFGVGHGWVKRKFIDPAKPGELVKNTVNVFNPRTGKREDITRTQVRIFGSYKENKYLSPEYVVELESITDKNKREAWLYGNWDITSGGMFDDIWSSERNVVKPFVIPKEWRVFRSFDWGSSKPFSVGWWAQSNGDDYTDADGKIKSSVRGDLFRIDEWYGWTGKENTGLQLTTDKITEGIVKRELNMHHHGFKRERIMAGPADSAIGNEGTGAPSSIAAMMARPCVVNGKQRAGVTWNLNPKPKGSRVNGWEMMRTAIANASPDPGLPRVSPALFVFDTCRDGFLRTVPSLPRDEKDLDDVDTDAEDHCGDECRYVILENSRFFITNNRIKSGHY